MDLSLWVTIAFIIIGFVFIIYKKKNIKNDIAFIKTNMESEEVAIKARFIVWWIVGTTAWGIVSITLIVWSFHNYYN
ncbi:hypothetical protein [Cytobacillus firmus]|uniref:hypothetical protein n=1 Tax=Cytobacillus firmus TaxID=1399 RepID=UPI001C975303|nr:hypothetical protein [Cytobacillus firmus]MBY6053151.1 hypothetical protein [Cytobacillus firmus]URT71447.1 hypothetical protein NAF01_02950 [Cytobacillus firmus]WHY34731.1 hypothetical protein QNH44_02940 [Cytobacillus firmus]WHY62348.1 hypothetical protein QNH42_02950 [Cytobacillus firmus]